MGNREIIKKGDVIQLFDGTLQLTGGTPGCLFFGIRTTYDEFGEVEEVKDVRYTAEEIRHLMKERDGRNHNVYFDF